MRFSGVEAFKRLQILACDRPFILAELVAGELTCRVSGVFSFSLDDGFVIAEEDSVKLIFSGDEGELDINEDVLKGGCAEADSKIGLPIAILDLPRGIKLRLTRLWLEHS